MKFTIKTSSGQTLTSQEVEADSVVFDVNGKKVEFWIGGRDGEVGVWFEDGLIPLCNGGNHLRIANTTDELYRCPHCGQHTTLSKYKPDNPTRMKP